MSTVSIFGAGISGLTVAHELAEQGYKVHVYEKLSDIGGMARSRRESGTNIPTEHSWRGFAPFYKNFDQIAKRIPYNDKLTVYDQLSDLAVFLLPKDDITDPNYSTISHVTTKDKLIITHKLLKTAMAGTGRTNDYSTINARDYFWGKLSPSGKDIFTLVGPWLGLDQYNCSLIDITKYFEMTLQPSYVHKHRNEDGNEWTHKTASGWHLMKRPTNEAWFYPWIKYLKSIGVEFTMEAQIKDINIDKNKYNNKNDNKVISCVIENKDGDLVKIVSDYYVMAVDPFTMQKLISTNKELQQDPNMIKFNGLVQDGPQVHISFRLAFSEQVHLGSNNRALSLPDSEFNITLYPQDAFFSPDVSLGEGVKGLWSGTVCVSTVPGKLYDLPAELCSKEQFINEVIYQIYRCKQLDEILKLHNNGRTFNDFDRIDTEVWYEWEFGEPGDMVQNKNPKWVSSATNYLYRPDQKTAFINLFMTGSHTKTSVNIWSMEGAVESGKLVVKKMGAPVELYTHVKPAFIRPFSAVDNVLYAMWLPNILYIVCLLIILLVVWGLWKIISLLTPKKK